MELSHLPTVEAEGDHYVLKTDHRTDSPIVSPLNLQGAAIPPQYGHMYRLPRIRL